MKTAWGEYVHRCLNQGILKGGIITVPLTSCLTGLESAVWQLKNVVFISKTDIQTSQTGQQNSDTSLFSIPFLKRAHHDT